MIAHFVQNVKKDDSDEEPDERRGRKGSKRSLGSDDDTAPVHTNTVRVDSRICYLHDIGTY